MDMARLLPIGIQDFTDIRERVDKTPVIHRMITGFGKANFLSRPRRFGKSLLCSTMDAVFEGRRLHRRRIAVYNRTHAGRGRAP